jgi:predicted ATP-grasp superfamily ATP-dependent carboligase
VLFEKALRHVAGNEVLVQEIIPGAGSNQFSMCMFVKDGRAIGRMAAKRWRQHPREFGRAATFVETVDCPQLEEPTLRFLRAIGYYGLAEIEYKLDSRDGQYKLLDVNARTWGFHGLGPSAGVDFSYLLFADQVGRPVETCFGRPGVGWIRMVTDIPTSFTEIVSGRLALRSYVDTLKNFSAESVFSRDDVMPTLLELALIPYLMAKRGY